jgi:tRNA splicing ligase
MINNITYAEVKLTVEQVIEESANLAFYGAKVCITIPKEYVHSLLNKIFQMYDMIGVDDSIPIGKGSLTVLADSIEQINKNDFDTVFCEKNSIIGRNSIPLLGNIRMIRVV